MKGILLAGGSGSRLGELTRVVSKHLLPVGDVPMLYHPLRRLIEVGCTEICIVSNQVTTIAISLMDNPEWKKVVISFNEQKKPLGIAHALGLCEDFAAGERVLVVLGDNVFDGPICSRGKNDSALVWVTQSMSPQDYGVVEFAPEPAPWLIPVSIEEKPAKPRSSYIATGIYCYPPDVFGVIRTLRPSARGELEITDVNRWYLDRRRLECISLPGRWFDCGGSAAALARASVQMLS